MTGSFTALAASPGRTVWRVAGSKAAGSAADQDGPLERLGVHLLLGDGQDLVEMHAVGRPRDGDRVAAAGPDRAAQPVGQEDLAPPPDGARRPDPVSGAGPGRRDGQHGLLRPGRLDARQVGVERLVKRLGGVRGHRPLVANH
jgi:hypothetical protein